MDDVSSTRYVPVAPQLQVTFSQLPGLYLYHCHILEHEDMGMMRNFRITGRA